MHKISQALIRMMSYFQDLALFAMRLTLALGFYKPAVSKLYNFPAIVEWFANDLHLPYPYLNALFATATEALGVIFMVLGFKTRFIAIPMMVIMVIAITTVHLPNGFSAANNGFEIPFYYLIMLALIVTTGPGKYSLDETFLKKYFGSPSNTSFEKPKGK